jgi:hypothetical protein
MNKIPDYDRYNVELYFKHRYKKFNFKLGSLTEYFRFPDWELVLEDLRQMNHKSISEVEREILEDNYRL